MLISTKTKNEKIVLGLLSYTYPDGAPGIEEQKTLIQRYQEDENSDLLLYRDDKTENYVGLVGIELNKSDKSNEDASTTIILHRIAVIPSFRNEGIGFKIYCELKNRYPNSTIIGSILTMDLVTKWTSQYNANDSE